MLNNILHALKRFLVMLLDTFPGAPNIILILFFKMIPLSPFIGKCHFVNPLAMRSCCGLTSRCDFCDLTIRSLSGAVILVCSWLNPFKVLQASRLMYVEHLAEM